MSETIELSTDNVSFAIEDESKKKRTVKEKKGDKEEIKDASEEQKEKLKKLDVLFNTIKKEQGDDVVIDVAKRFNIPSIPLSSPILGQIFGHGSCPLGKIIELYGKESSGKSLIAQQIGADYQKAGQFVTYIDLERSFSYDFANKLGLNTDADHFKLLEPLTGEDAFTIVQQLAESKAVGLIIFDSLAGVSASSEFEAGFDEAQMAVNARLISKALRKVAGLLSKSNTTIIFINQTRKSLSMYSPTVTTGGESVKFWASIRIEISKKENILFEGNEDNVIGIHSKIKNTKNKVSRPFVFAEVDIYFDKGFDIPAQYFDIGVNKGVIDKAGAWYSYNNKGNTEKIGQGRENSIKYLKENEEIFLAIKEKVDAILTVIP